MSSGATRRGALGLLAFAMLVVATPVTAQNPPGAPPPRPGTRPIVVPQRGRVIRTAERVCAGSCPKGAAPTDVSATATGAFEVDVEWLPSPWATGHVILRGATASGPFEVVGTDTTPGPQLALLRAQQQAAAKPIVDSLGRPIRSSAVLAAQRGTKFQVNSVFTDRRAIPRNTYFYRVAAQFAGTDSVDSPGSVSAPVTTKEGAITGLAGETDASLRQVILMWDEPPFGPRNYTVKRDGTVMTAEIRDFSPGRKMLFDNVTVQRAAPPTYEVTAFYFDGSRSASISGTATVKPKSNVVAWCRKVLRTMRVVTARGPLSGTDLAIATFPVTVTAFDEATGAPVAGTVTIRGGQSSSEVVSGPTGQPLQVRACTDTKRAGPISAKRIGAMDSGKQVLAATSCSGTVTAPGFGARMFQVGPQ